jgi:protein SCO1/2
MVALWRLVLILSFSLTVLWSARQAGAYNTEEDRPLLAHETPKELEDVGITEKLGDQLDPTLTFVSDKGESVRLGQYFDGKRPVLLTMVYYTCPSLCNYHLNGLLEVFKKMEWVAGKEFQVVAISMNHREGPDVAAKKKANYLSEYGHPEMDEGWHFLTGTEENVKKVADQLGFGFRWNESTQQYAHAAAAFISTPGGQLSRYLYGIEFPPQTLKLALLEASNGKIGSVVDQLILFCFQFDPGKNKYTIYAYNLMRMGAALVVIVLGIILIPMWVREKKPAD